MGGQPSGQLLGLVGTPWPSESARLSGGIGPACFFSRLGPSCCMFSGGELLGG